MSSDDFIRGYLGLMNHKDHDPDTVKLLANIVDTTKDGHVLICQKVELKINCVQ